MKAKVFTILKKAVENGVEHGCGRANEYDSPPSEHMLKQAICEAVMNEIGEWFVFDDDAQ